MKFSRERDRYWMQKSLLLADKAESINEVPVGAVLVNSDGELLAEGWNSPITDSDPTAHAEIMALRNAGRTLGNYRLPGTSLYVTLEPCAMCAGAIIHARIKRVVFGAYDPRTGAAGSVFDLLPSNLHNHRIEVTAGVMRDACATRIQAFFKQRRSGGGTNL